MPDTINADKCDSTYEVSMLSCTLEYDPAIEQEFFHPPDSGPEQEPFGAEKGTVK